MRRIIIALSAVCLVLMAASAWAAVDDAYSVDLLHFDGGITDEAGVSWSPVGNATSTASEKKFGTGALTLGGSEYLSADDSDDWAFGTGPFTIDCWIYVPYHIPLTRNFLSQTSWPGIICFYLNNKNKLQFSGGYAGEINLTDSNELPAEQWVHVAVSRDGSDFRMFKNGELVANASSASAMDDCSAIRYIGSDYFSGYIDELRVSKGIARWTAPFTPPSAAYGEAEPAAVGGRLYLVEGGRINIGAGGRINFK